MTISHDTPFDRTIDEQSLPVRSARTMPDGTEPISLGSGIVEGILGTGGMARVYRIWNERLEVHRAVKLLSPSDNTVLALRFETEAKITAKLRHPNIVEIHAVGEWHTLPYIEMELIDGETLDAAIKRQGALPLPVCSAVAVLIARALAYAHGHVFTLRGTGYTGLIHRDLKPSNVMISRSGIVKLMDFGIARPTAAGFHTVDGRIVGTLHYLSPEQIDGSDIDARSDIYSFGSILYEMVTGARTFPQATVTNVMRMKATGTYRSIALARPEIDRNLAAIIDRCLALDKTRRYADGTEVLAALETLHSRLGRGYSPEETLQRWLENPASLSDSRKKSIPIRHIVFPALTGLAAVCLLGLFILGFRFLLPASPPNPMADVQWQDDTAISPPAVTAVDTPARKKTAEHTPALKTEPSVRDKTKELMQRYGKVSPLDAGLAAFDAGMFDDAADLLQTAPPEPRTTACLFAALVESGRYGRARALNIGGLSDAYLDILQGKMALDARDTVSALRFFQISLTRPSAFKSRATLLEEALYQTALIRNEQYSTNPSEQNRLQTISAWNALKKSLSSNPDNPRVRRANEKLADIR